MYISNTVYYVSHYREYNAGAIGIGPYNRLYDGGTKLPLWEVWLRRGQV